MISYLQRWGGGGPSLETIAADTLLEQFKTTETQVWASFNNEYFFARNKHAGRILSFRISLCLTDLIYKCNVYVYTELLKIIVSKDSRAAVK